MSLVPPELGFSFLEKPRYYDAPDGEKPIDKVVALSKKGFLLGMVVGLTDCVWMTGTKNAVESLNCMAYSVVPIVGMSATFAATTYMATKLRGKDDIYNYGIGALCCSPIIHAWKKSTPTTMWGTLAFVIAAMAAKDKAQTGWEVFPVPKHVYGLYQADFTVMEKRDKHFRSPYF